MVSGRLTDKQREIKQRMEALIFLIYKESGNCEFFEATNNGNDIDNVKRIIGNIASSMVEDFKTEDTEDVRRAYSSLIRAKR